MTNQEIIDKAPDGAEYYVEIFPRVHYFKKIGNTFYIRDSGMWINLFPQDGWIESKVKSLK